jgi:predicted small lipoprotein YifL
MTSTSRPAGAAPVAGAMLVMLAALGLGGCGQTGPLYLPDSGTVVTRPTPSAPESPTTVPPAKTPADPAPAPASPPPKG